MLSKNLKTKKKIKKLNYINIKPFFIKTKKKAISYKFKLYKDVKVYSIYITIEIKQLRNTNTKNVLLPNIKKNQFKVKEILD